jgi:penicillin amidase
MRKFFNIVMALLILTVPVALVLGLLFNNLSRRSFYSNEGELKINGLQKTVRIYSDSYGVPHIIAETNHDAYFCMGYMHAKDRLWQMDLSRRVAEGRLSEILGAETLNYDKLFRTIGINRLSHTMLNKISPLSRHILDSYSAGVNRFIEDNYNNLPVEFGALNYKPEKWKPEHSLMIARLMAWDLNLAWYTDYIIGLLVNKVGVEKTSEIFPDTSVILLKKTINDSVYEQSVNYPAEFGQIKGFINTLINYRNYFNLGTSFTGSNSWVISSRKSAYGMPVLCNDPHLVLQAPSRWYEIHLKSDSLDVRGMSFAGVPGIVIGNNTHIAWGLTNLMNDDNDFIILEKDPENTAKYLWENSSHYPDSLTEVIYIKNSPEVNHVVRISLAGPVVSDLLMKEFTHENISSDNSAHIALKWTGYEPSDEVLVFYRINTAKGWNEFRDALKDFCAPAQNFIYADIYGNIGYQCAGKIPLRNTEDPSNFVYPAKFQLKWNGFVEFEKLPSVFNPSAGYIVTANTDPFGWLNEQKNKFYISYLWEPVSRFKVIDDFIASRSRLDIDDCKLMQITTRSHFAENISRYIKTAYENYNGDNIVVANALEKIKSWNGDFEANNPCGSVFSAFIVFLLKNTFEDELGKDIYDAFISVQNIPYRSLERIIQDKNNQWFDNVNTTSVENRDDIIRLSFTQTAEFLTSLFGSDDIESWSWGKIHRVKFSHMFGFSGLTDKAYNIGDFEIGGDKTSPLNAEYSLKNVINKNDFSVVVGASMRMIVNLSDILHPLTVNSTGQSGQPLHINYSDQTLMWLFGDYKKNTMNPDEMIRQNYRLLILTP